jgi:hypothetical protein
MRSDRLEPAALQNSHGRWESNPLLAILQTAAFPPGYALEMRPVLVVGEDSNLRSLQTTAINHSATPPECGGWNGTIDFRVTNPEICRRSIPHDTPPGYFRPRGSKNPTFVGACDT